MVTLTSAPAERKSRPPQPEARGSRRRRNHMTLIAWGFATPFVVLFLVFLAGPDRREPRDELHGLHDARPADAVQRQPRRLRRTTCASSRIRDSCGACCNTFIFVVVGVPLTMGIALLVALALNTGIQRFRTVYRVGFYAPVVTSIVAIAVVWRFILQPDGLLNGFLEPVRHPGSRLAAGSSVGAAVAHLHGRLAEHRAR